MKSGATSACRVLTPRTINGRACHVGDIVYLDDPALGFLIKHGIVELQSRHKAGEGKRETIDLPMRKRGEDGPAV